MEYRWVISSFHVVISSIAQNNLGYATTSIVFLSFLSGASLTPGVSGGGGGGGETPRDDTRHNQQISIEQWYYYRTGWIESEMMKMSWNRRQFEQKLTIQIKFD